AAMLGTAPANCVAIEDSPNGIASARAAGCVVVGVPGEVDLSAVPGITVVRSLTEVDVPMLRHLVAAGATRPVAPAPEGPAPSRPPPGTAGCPRRTAGSVTGARTRRTAGSASAGSRGPPAPGRSPPTRRPASSRTGPARRRRG